MKKLITLTTIGILTLQTTSAMQFCIQVIQPAYNPQTGECKLFPTPCDVPSGWIKTAGCVKDKFSEIKTQFRYLNPTIEKKIDEILKKKLFDKIKTLDLKKQLEKLEQVNEKVIKAIEKINSLAQKYPNNKKYQLILEILLYVQQKINYQIQSIKYLLSEF